MAYFEFIKKKFSNNLAYKSDYIVGIISTIISYIVFCSIYKALYRGVENVDGISFSTVATYFLFSLCLSNVYNFDDEFIKRRLGDDQLYAEFLMPVNFRLRILAESLGENLFGICFYFFPTLVFSLLFMKIQSPVSFTAFLLFLFSAALGYLILWEISFIIMTSAFWVYRIWSISTMKNVIINIFSGTMIPLWFMPSWVMNIIKFTPFDSIYYIPIKIYLGLSKNNEIAINICRQLIWIGIFYIIGQLLWKLGEKKVMVLGGNK